MQASMTNVRARTPVLWSAPRIHGELLKLAFVVAQSTAAIATNVSSAGSADRSSVPWWHGLDPPKGPVYSAISWKVKSVEPAGAAGSRSMPKSRGRKPKKPRAPTKGAPKQLIAQNTPPREPPTPAQTVQQEPSIPRQTLLQSILKWTMKSVKRAWVLLVTQRGSFT